MRFLSPASALIIIDAQNDFCPAYTSPSGKYRPDGALAVSGAHEIIDPLNALSEQAAAAGARVILTADWHPAGHVSFASSRKGAAPGSAADAPEVSGQALWPVHCVQGEDGAAFHDRLNTKRAHLILRKGFRPELDSYSAFFENDRKTPTGLEGFLKGLGITTVLIGGLATDYCVRYSALDAAALGYRVIVLTDAVRGVGYPEGSVEQALSAMEQAGVILADSREAAL
ncbi:MAG: bifunctional nicotinamidase/pyrazinamidase [Spirochaetaceae bacterium]|jgi:nicotinamidase/pyrazinamidase|nr:bifunctional nicotinamidase/pyrazinamidase [Spirochaetaceae bacterium]